MAGITLAQAEAQLASYLDAETAVLAGQSFEHAGRRLTRANLAEIRAGIEMWDAKVKNLSRTAGGGSRARVFNPGF